MYFTLFKKTIAYFVLVLCIPISIFIVACLKSNPDAFGVFIVLLLIFIPIGLAFAEFVARVDYIKLHSFLIKDCNPNNFINAANKLHKRPNNSKLKIAISADLVDAYIASGNYEKAIGILDSIDYSKIKTKSAINLKLNVLGCKSRIYTDSKNYDSAIACFNELKENIETLEDQRLKNNWIKFMPYIENMLLYLNGELVNVNSLIKEFDENPKTNIDKVSTMLFLSELYLKNGDKDKAKEYLEKVIALGNQTIYVQRAKEMLAENF